MMRGVLLKLDGKGLAEGLRELWARMLDGPVGALILPVQIEGGWISPGLVVNREGIEHSRALAPYMPLNGARVLQALTGVSGPPVLTVAVLRPCEVRAAVELRKLNQISRENLLLASMDCLGTYPLKPYEERLRGGEVEEVEPAEDAIREACKVCLWPVSPWADLRICFIGLGGNLFLEAVTPEGERLLRELGFEVHEHESAERNGRLSEILRRHRAQEEVLLERQKRELRGYDGLLRALSRCIRCHNCMTACPICYCRECFFESPAFRFEAERFMELARSRPVLRLPSDVLLFHLTRMAHMATSCVCCGMCQEACPQEVRVFELFKAVSKRLQAIFDYEPGRDPDEPLPLTTFREEELGEFED